MQREVHIENEVKRGTMRNLFTQRRGKGLAHHRTVSPPDHLNRSQRIDMFSHRGRHPRGTQLTHKPGDTIGETIVGLWRALRPRNQSAQGPTWRRFRKTTEVTDHAETFGTAANCFRAFVRSV